MNVVLMAGGGGTRLWPLSRRQTPKQFLDLGGGKTLLENAYDRACQLTNPARIYVATISDYHQKVSGLLPDIPSERILLEPEKRDTTGAFASIAVRLQHQGQGDTPTIFMWSDHIFTNEDAFIADLKKIPALIEHHPDHLVIVGHTPITPETGLGYFEVGERLAGYDNVYHLRQFREKPDQTTAEQFTASGRHFWNLGYFSLKPRYLLEELKTQAPETTAAIDAFTTALNQPSEAAITAAYQQFPKVAIEYTLIEKTPRRLAITGDYGWSDVGNWTAVKDIFGTTGDHAPHGHHIHVNANNNYIYNTTNQAVTLLGVNNTIVVVTDDAILITDQDHTYQVKDLVTKLEEENQTDVL